VCSGLSSPPLCITVVVSTVYYVFYLGKGRVAVNNIVTHLNSLDHHFTPESASDCKYTNKEHWHGLNVWGWGKSRMRPIQDS
jgi:hypothetical protein